jgi:hypothetical protein
MPTSIMVSGIPGATPVGVAASIDELSVGAGVTFTPSGATLGPITAADDYETICVVLYQQPATAAPVALYVIGETLAGQTAPQSVVVSSSSPAGPLFFPFPIAAGRSFSIVCVSLTGANVGPLGTEVYGLGMPYQPSPLRGDGRLMPVGALVGTNSFGGGTFTSQSLTGLTIPANARILVSTADVGILDPGTGTPLPLPSGNMVADIYGDMGVGSDQVFLASLRGTTTGIWLNKMPIPPQGLLMTPGTDLICEGYSAASENPYFQASFDLVL